MSGSLRPVALALAGISGAAAILCGVWLARHPSRTDATVPTDADRQTARLHPPGEPGRPHIEITADHRLKSVQHKDATGLSPLELIQTPVGQVRVQRTFRNDGTLMKEEAFLNGKPVPIPKD